MNALVRSASLTHFADVAAQHGLDAGALLAAAGLPGRCLHDPDLKVPAERVGALLELAAAQSRDAAFALRMAESRRLSNLGPLALLLRDEPTLRSALEAVVRFIHVHNEAMVLHLEQVDALVVIRIDLAGAGLRPLAQATELALGVTFRVLRLFLGAPWQPRLVCFTHGAPADLAVHRRVFGRAVEFGHDFNGIVCNHQALDAPNPGADPVMSRYAHQLLAPAAEARACMADRVRQLVLMLMPRGHCRVDRVAQHLGMDRRTVARQLAGEGTSFSRLVDTVRRDLMARYRDDGSRPLAEVAVLLGFSAPSAFSRWHRQHFGRAARDLQAQQESASESALPVPCAGPSGAC